jgi:hypothetical protein
MAVLEAFDPRDLASAGWAAVFHVQTPQAVRAALAPLLERRRDQAGPLYRTFEYSSGMSVIEFLARYGAGPGPADPEKVPYYLLLVGGPDYISFEFQQHLVQYAVGRVAFDTPEGYAAYARAVVRAESEPARRPARAVVFAPEHPNDPYTRRLTSVVTRPLLEQLRVLREQVIAILAEEATKTRLLDLLWDRAAPRLLFAAGHTIGFPAGQPSPLQAPRQGAIVCQDWQGPGGEWAGRPVPQSSCFSGDDLTPSDLGGLIAVLHGSFTAGTDSDRADLPFVAALPQRLLGNPDGAALAVIGVVGLCRTPTPASPTGWPLSGLNRLLTGLVKGDPVGHATEAIRFGYAEFAASLSEQLMDRRYGKAPDDRALAGLWAANNDARSYIILGDPAVRLSGDGPGSAPRPPGESLPAVLHLTYDWDKSEKPDEFILDSTYWDETGSVRASAPVRFDFARLARLRELLPLAERYVTELRAMGLGNPDVRRVVDRALAWPGPCRVRLTIRASAGELHKLRWEALFHSRTMYFSREVAGPIPPAPLDRSRELHAVAAVASPMEGEASNLPVIDAARELDIVRRAVGRSMTVRAVEQPLTLARISSELHTPCELFYLLCHTHVVDGQRFLLLADDSGQSTRVERGEFVGLFGKLDARPRIVFLAANNSAPLGPPLIEAGVPAVVAFRGQVTLSTVRQFATNFLRELVTRGEPDRAAAFARESLRQLGYPVWWTPVLFTAEGAGRLWDGP